MKWFQMHNLGSLNWLPLGGGGGYFVPLGQPVLVLFNYRNLCYLKVKFCGNI